MAGLTSGRAPDEKILSCFRRDGTPVWRAVDPLRSGDAVHDALKNPVFIRRAPGGGFRIVLASTTASSGR